MELKPIECKINVMEYVVDYGRNFSVRKVAISTRKTEKEIEKDLEYSSDYTVEMYTEQYEEIFAPLFEEIGRLNKQIEELNSEK